MRRMIALFAASVSFMVLAAPSAASAAIGEPDIYIHNSSDHEILVTVHVLLPPLYKDRWAAPGKTVTFSPGPMAWKGVLYISVRASTSPEVDTSSPHICLGSIPIKGDAGRFYTAHYNGRDCWLTQD